MAIIKPLFSSALLCLALTINVNAQEQKSYNYSVFSGYGSLPANADAVRNTRTQIASLFPGWHASVDKLNGHFTDIYGKTMNVPGKDNLEKAHGLMNGYLAQLGVNAADWKLVATPKARNADYVNFVQSIKGRKVMQARLSFRFTKEGKLARILMKSYGAPVVTAPSIAGNDAIVAARTGMESVHIAEAKTDEWVWFPVPAKTGYEVRPVWKVVINGDEQGSIPLTMVAYVDGVTGKLLYRTNHTRDIGLDGTVKGTVYKDNTTLPATDEPLVDLEVQLGTLSVFTDTGGHYSDPSVTLPFSTTFPLTGRYSRVRDYPTTTLPVFSTLVSSSPFLYSYPATSPASSRHVNAYYHTTRVHNFMKLFFPTFTDLDAPLPTVVDRTTGTCNAFANDTSINFFAASTGCNSFAEIGDIVYHEYGHIINRYFYQSVSGAEMDNGAMNEGYADVWAMCITHDPILGRNAFTTGGFIRRYNATPQVYPIDADILTAWPDPHKVGMIIAGAWWDLGIALGNVDTMARIYTDVFWDAPDNFDGAEGALYHEILIDALTADDNDGDLSNGTPHYAKIVASFARHGIYLEGESTLTHTELGMQGPGVPITVNTFLFLEDISYLHDFTLYYRLNNAGSWTSLPMTAVSTTNYKADIPAQPVGTTVEYYFVVHDGLSEPNVYFPITCNSSMPSDMVTLPFQFGVGVVAMDSTKFETPVTGFGIGGNLGDDALSGVWVNSTPASMIGGDHTTGSGKCLSAGNPVSSVTMRGTSTVTTPVFDLAGYTNPIVMYYRWFSNETGNSNFKNDPWIVKVNDGAGGAWQTVENTYQCEPEWRRRIFPVAAYLPGASKVQLKFYASDSVLSDWRSNGQGKMVVAVDDIYVMERGVENAVVSQQLSAIKMYPNPANDVITFELPTGLSATISVWDATGREVIAPVSAQAGTSVISIAKLAPGTYSAMVKTKVGTTVKKVVVLHD
ncbi:MAG: T9SS type A sorting domain-containing protein [Taibaiella sp.]|nr:T9SS type A sorting domain-containing protein [Taibaiella sp.]